MYDFLKGPSAPVPPTRVPIVIDVRDCALAHVRALERPEAAGKRIAMAAGSVMNQKIVDHLHTAFPELQDRLVRGEPGAQVDAGQPFSKPIATLDTTRATEWLGLTSLRSWQESVEDSMRALLEFEKQPGW